MRKVLFKKWIPQEYEPYENHGNGTRSRSAKAGTNCWSDFIHEGVFHQWANCYEEFEAGPANFTIAIIETEDGTIQEVLPSNIKFISN